MISFLVLILMAASSVFTSAQAAPNYPLHLDMEASSAEYEMAYKKIQALHPQLSTFNTEEDKALQDVIKAGQRNLQWLNVLNSSYEPDLKFTQPNSAVGYPLESPAKYSGKLVIQEFQNTLGVMPAELKTILLGTDRLPSVLPVPEADYLKWGQKIDRHYQIALRWQMMQPFLSYYARNQAYDIRGYVFLSREPELANSLKDYLNQPAARQKDLKTWLISQCRNNLIAQTPCEQQFEKSLAKNDVLTYFHMYQPLAKETYLEYFRLQNPRSDLHWETTQTARMAKISFHDPGTPELRDFIKNNIQDEWKWLNSALEINFTPQASVVLILSPDITPHVNGLGGNEIHMNSLQALTEWDTQYTLRHEFGHVLGFPDCYVEFFDPAEQVMMNYQIDTTDLMCSRAGRMNERLFEGLYKAYHR